MADTYSLKVTNNSLNAGVMCVFQTQPSLGPNVKSLAWFTKYTYPTTVETFEWQIDYSFIWDETGPLVPGIVFEASQTWKADLSAHNMVTFTYDNKYDGALTFTDLTWDSANPTSFHIHESATIPANVASVGLAMSGSGTFAVQAQPNMEAFFSPHPVYWICFGNFVHGQVMDIETVTAIAEVPFGSGRSMNAVLNELNTWTISPGH
jgi:rhizosphere induced protein